MINKNELIYITKLLTLTIPFIIWIIYFFLFKNYKNKISIKSFIYDKLLSKELEILLMMLIIGILIWIFILYLIKNNIELEINKYNYTKLLSPKTYEIVKNKLTTNRLNEVKNTPLYKRSIKKNSKSKSKKSKLEDEFNEIINESILL